VKITRPDLAALAICAIALVGIVVLSAMHTATPEILTTVALISLSAGVGIATQTVTPATVPAAVSEPVAAAEAVPAPVVIPAQAAVALEAPVATHAPA
jgi:hypothetical protein